MAHFLLVAFPAQGHINPTLQLAKHLSRRGVRVTFATTVNAHTRMLAHSTPTGDVSFATFPDGSEHDVRSNTDTQIYMSRLKQVGSQALDRLLRSLAAAGNPVSCILYSFLLPWIAQLAYYHHIPCAPIWLQPATIFSIYYHHFHNSLQSLDNHIELPGLPQLNPQDLPSFLQPSNTYPFVLPIFEDLFQVLRESPTKPVVLVNTFDAFEEEALAAVTGMKLVGIGPLIPSAFIDGKDPADTAFGGDLFSVSTDCMEWLNTQPERSIAYVSFGSLSLLSPVQMGEIARGLCESNRPFLWVIRQPENGGESGFPSGFEEEVGGRGLVVEWCNQVKVLSHRAVGCFVTHSGWNSTLEGVVMGVPMVCFPQWSDQPTNAKLVSEVFKTGVRVGVNEEGVLEWDELKRCLEAVMDGESGMEMRRNAVRWMDLVKSAVGDGGSSDRNVRAFIKDMTTTDKEVEVDDKTTAHEEVGVDDKKTLHEEVGVDSTGADEGLGFDTKPSAMRSH